MKRLTIILCITLAYLTTNAQRKFIKPDYASIEKAVNDPNSPYTYEKLMERYRGDDSSLTNVDYRYLYFGKIFTGSYSPYAMSPYSDSLRVYFTKPAINPRDYDDIIRLEKKVLEEQPFNIRDLNVIAYLYRQKGDSSSEEKASRKISGIVHAIMETGDGKTEESALHIISVAHEYDMLKVMGLEFGGQQRLTKNGCDYLKVKSNEMKLEGLYFDVTQILKSYERTFKK